MAQRKGRAKSSRQRDYKAEYARRIARAVERGVPRSVGRGHPSRGLVSFATAKRYKVKPGSLVRDIPFKPSKRGVSEDLIERETDALIEQGISIRDINAIDFHDEESFIKKLLELGYTPREAYQLRFSP
jgi:hypothetical protein